MASTEPARRPQVLGRYAVHEEIAAGGMATVHLGCLAGADGGLGAELGDGDRRAVAIKRLHPQFAKDPEFVSMLIDEARLAARVRHPNVVPTIEVVPVADEILLVMDYVAGDSLASLLRACTDHGERMPPELAAAIVTGALHGLHAAHEATSEGGRPLGIVHRDVSPQNILVGEDGTARVLDFGIAKAAFRLQTTRDGQLKGKLRYMAPEQLRGDEPSRQVDIYSAAVVLWEALTSERLFSANNDAALFGKVLEGVVSPPSRLVPGLPRALDEALLRALDRSPERRFATAEEMALALSRAVRLASASEVSAMMRRLLGPELARRAARVAAIERGSADQGFALERAAPSAASGAAVETVTDVAGPVIAMGGPVTAMGGPIPPMGRSTNAMGGAANAMVEPVTRTMVRAPSAAHLRGAAWGILGAALLAAAAGGVVWQRVSSGASATGASQGTNSSATSQVGAAPTLEAPPTTPGSTAAIAEPPAPPPAAEAAREIVLDEGEGAPPSAAPPGGRLGGPARGAGPSNATRPTSAASAAKPNCNPPYIEDATGIRRVKRECL